MEFTFDLLQGSDYRTEHRMLTSGRRSSHHLIPRRRPKPRKAARKKRERAEMRRKRKRGRMMRKTMRKSLSTPRRSSKKVGATIRLLRWYRPTTFRACFVLTDTNPTACRESKQCAPYKHHFDECVERVTKAQEESGQANEDCVEELCMLCTPPNSELR